MKILPKQQWLNKECYDILNSQMPGFEAWIKTALIFIASHIENIILLKYGNMVSFWLMVVLEHAILEE